MKEELSRESFVDLKSTAVFVKPEIISIIKKKSLKL